MNPLRSLASIGALLLTASLATAGSLAEASAAAGVSSTLAGQGVGSAGIVGKVRGAVASQSGGGNGAWVCGGGSAPGGGGNGWVTGQTGNAIGANAWATGQSGNTGGGWAKAEAKGAPRPH